MIFVTVGTQLPFDRMVSVVDKWAGKHSETEILVQSGKSEQEFLNCVVLEEILPVEWDDFFQQADFIVAHAGMGTILKSLDYNKPLVIMPRKAGLGEHRNDHQLATANKFRHFENIQVVESEEELWQALENPPSSCSDAMGTNENLERLISEIRTFIQKE